MRSGPEHKATDWFVVNASAGAVLGEGPISHSSSAIR